MPRNMIVLDKYPIVPTSVGGILIYPYPTSQEPTYFLDQSIQDVLYLIGKLEPTYQETGGVSGTARTRAKTLPGNQVVIKTGEQPQ